MADSAKIIHRSDSATLMLAGGVGSSMATTGQHHSHHHQGHYELTEVSVVDINASLTASAPLLPAAGTGNGGAGGVAGTPGGGNGIPQGGGGGTGGFSHLFQLSNSADLTAVAYNSYTQNVRCKSPPTLVDNLKNGTIGIMYEPDFTRGGNWDDPEPEPNRYEDDSDDQNSSWRPYEHRQPKPPRYNFRPSSSSWANDDPPLSRNYDGPSSSRAYDGPSTSGGYGGPSTNDSTSLGYGYGGPPMSVGRGGSSTSRGRGSSSMSGGRGGSSTSRGRGSSSMSYGGSSTARGHGNFSSSQRYNDLNDANWDEEPDEANWDEDPNDVNWDEEPDEDPNDVDWSISHHDNNWDDGSDAIPDPYKNDDSTAWTGPSVSSLPTNDNGQKLPRRHYTMADLNPTKKDPRCDPNWPLANFWPVYVSNFRCAKLDQRNTAIRLYFGSKGLLVRWWFSLSDYYFQKFQTKAGLYDALVYFVSEQDAKDAIKVCHRTLYNGYTLNVLPGRDPVYFNPDTSALFRNMRSGFMYSEEFVEHRLAGYGKAAYVIKFDVHNGAIEFDDYAGKRKTFNKLNFWTASQVEPNSLQKQRFVERDVLIQIRAIFHQHPNALVIREDDRILKSLLAGHPLIAISCPGEPLPNKQPEDIKGLRRIKMVRPGTDEENALRGRKNAKLRKVHNRAMKDLLAGKEIKTTFLKKRHKAHVNKLIQKFQGQ